MKHKVEICTDTITSVINAVNGGAYRVELCTGLELGGLTPSFGFVNAACRTNIKVNVLVRPRPGNFVYADDEFKIICDDIIKLKELNINGIVAGILTKDGNIDIERTKNLVTLTKPIEFTFHRAFDNCRNKEKAIKDVIKTGANRVLTSGFENNVTDGIRNIIELQNNYGHLIKIMPGGGINEENAQIFLKNGISEIHLSAGKLKLDTCYKNERIGGMGSIVEKNRIGYKYSDIETIKNIVNL